MNIEEKISIVIPVYNAEKYLHRCIQSILQQTHQNWVTIFVNDGSTDSSLSILQEYANKDSRFKIINKTNGGASSARNAGIDAVTTRYLIFVDADDSVMPGLIEKLLNAALLHGCDFVAASHRYIGIDRVMPVSGKLSTASPAYFRYVNPGPWSKLFKKDLLDLYNLRFPEQLSVFEDAYFTRSYAIVTRYIFLLPDVLYDYRFDNEQSLMHCAGKKVLPYEACRGCVDSPCMTFKFLCSQADSSNRRFVSDFALGLYRCMWDNYHSYYHLIENEDKRRYKQHFRMIQSDFSRQICFIKRITLLQRYPRLHAFLRWVRSFTKRSQV